jgi:transposase, IS5 family
MSPTRRSHFAWLRCRLGGRVEVHASNPIGLAAEEPDMAIQRYPQTTIWGWVVQQLLAPTHERLLLAQQLDWEAITQVLRPFYKPRGRYAKPMRLMVGLHLLKHRYDLSDVAVVQGVHENLYWMTFCGMEVGTVLAQAKLGEPFRFVDAATLTTWRRRPGPRGTRLLEQAVQQQLAREKGLQSRTMVTDTTAQEKHMAYPTDTALLDKGRRQLLGLIGRAKALGVVLPQGLRRFTRTAKTMVQQASRCGKDRLEHIPAANQQLSTMAPHVRRRVRRIVAQLGGKLGALQRWGHARAARTRQRRRDHLQQTAGLVRRVIYQNAEGFQGRHVPDKVLSLHEPHVVSICKGKRAKPAEYGGKVSLAMDRHGWVVTPTEYAANIADAETLPDALAGWLQVFGQPPPEVAADRGFHHPATDRARVGTAAMTRLSIPPKGKTRHPDANTAWFKRLQRLRSPIEPMLSHLKADHRMVRCRDTGFAGDQINVSWAVLAWNTKKWGRLLRQRLLATHVVPRRAA